LCETTPEALDALCVGKTHGGIIALCGERTLPLPTAENLPKNGFLCLLEGIEDPYNFGYAVRSLYAAGCDAVLVGERNWMSAAGVVARASAGASEALPLFSGNPEQAVRAAKSLGYTVACAGIRDSVSYTEAALKKPLLLVVGGEKRGVSAGVLALCDQTVRFRTHHHVGRFDADHDVVIIEIVNHAHFIDRALNQSFGGDMTVLRNQFFLKRSGIDSDTNRNIPHARSRHNLPDPFGPSDIAGIDPDLVRAVFHGPYRHLVIKMDIRHQRDVDPLLDLSDCKSCFLSRTCASDDLASSLLQTQDLGNCSLHIFSRGVSHGLDQDGVASADHSVADPYYFCMVTISHFFSFFLYSEPYYPVWSQSCGFITARPGVFYRSSRLYISRSFL
jgi:hypothetical protein